MKISLAEVKRRCTEGRFFAYDGLNDRIFSPLSPYAVWFFLRLGWSGNGVSLLSGALAAAGGCLMATQRPVAILVGSFGYMLFFFLDYVDGGVARIRGASGIGGQYVDWTMHTVSALGVTAGLFAGALGVAGSWIIPFGVATVIASALSLDRYALGWFSITMHYQQQQAKGTVPPPPAAPSLARKHPILRWLRNLSTILFHESYAIALLPALALWQLLAGPWPIDFRVALMVLGGIVYLPVVVYDVWLFATEGRIDAGYRRLFWGTEPPRLPEDHYF